MSANMKTKMIKVEGALAEAEKICAKYQVKDHIKLAALGAFSKNCILAVIEKKHKDLPFFGSVEAAGVEFVQNLNEQMGSPGMVSPWVVPLAPSQPEASSSGKQKIQKNAHGEKTFEPFGKICIEPLRAFFLIKALNPLTKRLKIRFFVWVMPLRLRTLDSMGRISNAAMLKDAGFTEGMTVYRKTDDTTAVIQTMAAGQITLKVGDALKTCSSESFLKGSWKPSRDKAEPEKIDSWLRYSPQNSKEHMVAAMRAKVVYTMYVKATPSPTELELFAKPKQVKALKKFPKGALRLELQTYKVDIKTDDKGAGGSVCLGHFADKDRVSVMFLFTCIIGKDWQIWHILGMIVTTYFSKKGTC